MFGLQVTPALKLGAIFIAIVGLFSFGYYKGYAHEKEKFDAFKVELAATVAAQEAKNKQIINESAKISKDTSDAYLNNLGTVRDYYKRLHNAGTSAVPSVPKGSSGANEGTPNSLPGQCAETTLQLIYLQEWINRQENNHNNQGE